MTSKEASNFIKKINFTHGDTWADLGAGSGIFSHALSDFLGENGKVYAIDSDPKVLAIKNNNTLASIIPIQADFTKPLNLPSLDGIFLGNALHYVKDQTKFLQQLIPFLEPSGKIAFIEYDREDSNPWIPYPVPFWKLKKVTLAAGLTEALELNRRSSIYGNGEMYLAISKNIK